MADRKTLQATLESILGSRNVYYNPPETIRMSYPAIVYDKSRIKHLYANDNKYRRNNCYTITLISNIPDNPILDKLLELPLTEFDRSFKSENLYHEVITIYY